MKSLLIESPQYQYLLENFREWLDVLGYSKPTVSTLPIHVRELLYYLETQKKVQNVKELKASHVFDFANYLKQRPAYQSGGMGNQAQSKGGALSPSSINKCLQAVNTFAKYLSIHGHRYLDVHPRRVKQQAGEPPVLSQKEIQQLYDASYDHERGSGLAMGQRDRALLAIFYGCGLRKSEGEQLQLEDIDLHRGLILVRNGKGKKERYVPILGKNLEDLQSYMEQGRYWFMEDHRQSHYHEKTGQENPIKINVNYQALFLSRRGRQLSYNGVCIRLKKLKDRAGINKDFSLHSLRHSIATHLLQSGMELQDISKFLGHASLESTQIYTHIVSGLKILEDEWS